MKPTRNRQNSGRWIAGSILALACIWGAPPAGANANVPRAGEILLLDGGETSAGLLAFDLESGSPRSITNQGVFTNATSLAWDHRKRIYVADGDTIHVVNPYDGLGAPIDAVTHPHLREITDLVPDGEGGYWVLDAEADPLDLGHQGSIFHFDPSTSVIELVLTSGYFQSAASLVVEDQGTLLVMDPTGRLSESGPAEGAIYRIDPVAKTIAPVRDLSSFLRPTALLRLDPQTLILIDANFTVPGMTVLGGALLKLSSTDFTVLDTLAITQFREPVQATPVGDGTLVVIDEDANEGGVLYRIDATSSAYVGQYDSSVMTTPVHVDILGGACLETSLFSLEPLDGILMRRGGRARFQADLINIGQIYSGDFDLTVTMYPMVCLLGTAVVPSGTAGWDAERSLFTWTGALGAGAVTTLQVEALLPNYGPDVSTIVMTIDIEGDLVESHREIFLPVAADLLDPAFYILDVGTTAPAPQVLVRTTSGELEQANIPQILDEPLDLTLGPDGLLYILDNDEGDMRVFAADVHQGGAYVLHESHGVPLSRFTAAICLGHDGRLLIADPKITHGQINQAGVIYALDRFTGVIDTFFTHEHLIDPYDISPAQNGLYLVVDSESSMLPSNPDGGGLFLIDREGQLVDMVSFSAFEDPISGVAAANGAFYITDLQLSADPPAPKVFEVQKFNQSWVNVSILQGLAHPLKTPYGIVEIVSGMSHEAGLWICERDKSPVHPGDHGLIARMSKQSGSWQISTEHLDIELISPTRMAVFRMPRTYIESFSLSLAEDEVMAPGDTLVVGASVFCNSPIPALGSSARLTYPPSLEVVSAEATLGSVVENTGYGSLIWSGNLSFYDPVAITARFVVSETAGVYDAAEITLDLEGGGSTQHREALVSILGLPTGDEIFVLDQEADPFGLGHSGAIYYMAEESNELIPFRSHWLFRTLSDFLPASSNQLYVLDSDADPRGFGGEPGAILRLNLESGGLSVIYAPEDAFVEPVRMVPLDRDTWFIIDQDVELASGDARGAVYEFELDERQLTPMSVSNQYRELVDLTIDGDGNLWVADRSANPLQLPGNTGAIFKLDGATGSILETHASEEIVDPAGVLWVSGTGVLVTDPGYTDEFGSPIIRTLDPSSGELTDFAMMPGQGTPGRIYDRGDGSVVIIDDTAWFTGAVGAVFNLDLDTGGIWFLADDQSTEALLGVTQMPGADPYIVSFTADEDVTGRWASRGDTLHCKIVLGNRSVSNDPIANLVVDLSEHLTLESGSALASSGTLQAGSTGLEWDGNLSTTSNVTIRYNVVIGSQPELSSYSIQAATLTPGTADPIDRTLVYYLSTVVGSEELIGLDSRMNPLGIGGGSGALFRFAEPNRVPVIILADSSFVSPVAIQRIPGSETEYLIVDSDADTGGQTAGGALFKGNTETGEVEMFYTNEDLIEPISIAIADSSVCYLLDLAADPYGLTTGIGPGAVYAVNLLDGSAQLVFSDTLTARPRDVVYDPFRKSLLVVDNAMDPEGSYKGGLVEIFLESQHPDSTVWVVESGHPFESPRAAVVLQDSSWILLDYSERQESAMLFNMSQEGGSQILAFCSSMEDPMDLVPHVSGALYLVDASADPQGFGVQTGTFFTLGNPSINPCNVFRSGPPLIRPRGGDSFFDPTPIFLHLFEVAEQFSGVEVRWSAPLLLEGADYYVYRRSVQEPNSQFEVLNWHEPVRGGGELTFFDEEVIHGEVYAYKLVATLPNGAIHAFGPVTIRIEHGRIPFRFNLEPVYPSPVALAGQNGTLSIRFQIPEPANPVRLGLFDVSGRLVHWLIDRPMDPGSQVLVWDGRDGRGAPVGSGVYFLRLEAGRRVMTRRVVILY